MKIQVCTGKACSERFSEYIVTRVENEKKKYNLKNVDCDTCMCLWHCKKWPNILKNGEVQNYMNPVKVAEMINPSVYSKKKKK